jgi:hypothetical protein
MGRATGELLIASREPLPVLLAELDSRSGTRLEATGAEVGDLVLRPDGGVAFELLLEPSRVVHSTWWSRQPVRHYRVRLCSPDARPVPLRLRLTPGRARSSR